MGWNDSFRRNVRWPALAAAAVCLFGLLLTGHAAAQEREPVSIGVLAKRGAQRALEQWQPTADYLTRQIPGYRFRVVPLDFDQVYQAAGDGEVDFILANSGIYVELESLYGAGRIATMRNLGPVGVGYTRFGGVVFTRADRDDIARFADLKGKRFAAVEENSFGGFLIALRELVAAGIDPYRDVRELQFAGTHDAVVHAVLDGRVDAGTVRTDTLERMAIEGRIDLADIKVIGPRRYDDFGYLASTRLYPEWPFARLPHASDVLSDSVASALLAMPADSEAARTGRVVGWTTPRNYQPVHELMRELAIGPYQGLNEISLTALIRQYWAWLAAIAVSLLLLALSNAYALGLNRRLRRSDEQLREARDHLADKVRERTEALETTLTELAESNRRLDLALQDWNDAFDAIKDPIFIHDQDMRIVAANPAYAARAGLPREALTGRIYHELFPRQDEPLLACRTFPEEIHDEGEALVLSSGEIFVSRSFAIQPAVGAEYRAIHILEDVTAEHRAEARRRSLSRAVEQAGEGIVLLDAARTVSYCNPAFIRLFGGSEAEEHGRPLEALFGDGRAAMEQLWTEAEQRGSGAGELTLSTRDGREIPVYLSLSGITDENGEIEGYVASTLDLSALKQAEDELQYRVRFESVIGNIAARFLAIHPDEMERELVDALRRLGQFIGVDRAFMFRCTGQDERSAIETAAWAGPGVARATRVVLDLEQYPWLRSRLSAGDSVTIDHLGQLPDEAAAERALLSARGTGALLLMPLASRQDVIGFFGFEHVAANRGWRSEEVRLMRTAAEILANALARHEAEEAVRKSEATLAEAQRIAHIGNWNWDIVTNELAWSDEIYRIFGVSPQEFGATYDAFLGYIHPDDRERVVTAVNHAVYDRAPYAIDHRIVVADGGERVVHESGKVSYSSAGDPLRMVGTVQDVTEARHAEWETRRLNRALRTLSRGNTTLVHATDETDLLHDVCDVLIETGGYRFAWVGVPQDDPERTVRAVAHAGHEAGYLKAVTVGWGDDERGQGPTGTALRSREPAIVRDIRKQHGFELWRREAAQRGYSSVIALPLISEGELYGALTIDAAEADAFDVAEVALLSELAGDLAFGIRTLRLRAERERAVGALHESEKRYHDLYDTAPTGYASVDGGSGRLLQCNPAFAEMLGYARDELIGRPVLELYADTPEGLPRAKQVLEVFRSGSGVRDRELQMQRRDGAPLWVSLSVEPVFDAAGDVVESRSSITDISARKAAEAQRRDFAERQERSLLQTIEAIALTIEKRDPYTAGHQQRVAELAVAIAEAMGLPREQIHGLRLGALIHDIGKVYVPTEILNRPGRLDDAQFLLIKSHPQVGYDIVKGIDFPWPLAEVVVQHHERLDGSGYPRGLAGDDILLEARIIAVADVVEAMASHRPYRAALPLEEALAEIERYRGVRFDAAVVDVCVRLFREQGFTWSSQGARHTVAAKAG